MTTVRLVAASCLIAALWVLHGWALGIFATLVMVSFEVGAVILAYNVQSIRNLAGGGEALSLAVKRLAQQVEANVKVIDELEKRLDELEE